MIDVKDAAAMAALREFLAWAKDLGIEAVTIDGVGVRFGRSLDDGLEPAPEDVARALAGMAPPKPAQEKPHTSIAPEEKGRYRGIDDQDLFAASSVGEGPS